jgi:pimeloyl-ACP methyl ester carboxylesterase
MHPAPRFTLARLLPTAAAFALASCGANGPVRGPLADRDATPYLSRCDEFAAAHKKDLDQGAYNPPVVFVHLWPGRSSSELFMPEARLVSALDAGEVKRVSLTARGGLGKTLLAEAIRAQVCHTTPIFSVDLKKVAALAEQTGPTANAVFEVVAQDLGAAASARKQELLQTLMEVRWIMLADAIEEVDLVKRTFVVQQLDRLAALCPQVQIVVLARPPVFDGDYGFANVDARLEIPPLDCKVAEAFVARAYKGEAERERFQRFLKRHGLDEQTRFGMQCMYPYLSTYRDIQTMAKFEQGLAKGDADDKGLRAVTAGELASRSAVYEALIGSRLIKEFENLRWTTTEALDMVDRLVRVQTEATGRSTLAFDMDKCLKSLDARWGDAAVDAGVGGTPEQRRRHVCEKTFQSALFQKTEGTKTFAFADSGTTHLFLARWLNGELARSATGDCKILDNHAELLVTPGVVRFFVGQPMGQRCLAQVANLMCAKSDKRADHVALVDEGLPGGPGRVQPLLDARAMAGGMTQKACVTAIVDDLDKTVGAANP